MPHPRTAKRVVIIASVLGAIALVNYLVLTYSRQAEPKVTRIYAPKSPPTSIVLKPLSITTLEKVLAENGRDAKEYAILEIVGTGLGTLDYDLDGRTDLYFPCGGTIDGESESVFGRPSFLIKNIGLEEAVDVTEPAGVAAADMYSHGIAAADLNHDGFDDMIVYGYQGIRLFMNNGDGTFADQTELAGINDLPWTTSVAIFDANQDGFLDVYGACYVDWSFDKHPECEGWYLDHREVCPPARFTGMPDWFLQGKPDGTFERQDARFESEELGRGLGALAFRPTHESIDTELYIANDMMNNWHFIPDGAGKFQDDAVLLGNAVDIMGNPTASMGVGLMDANNDGAFDIFVTNFDHEYMSLYCGGLADYSCETLTFGLAAEFPPSVAFGVIGTDFDCDGDEDVFVTCGGVEYEPSIHDMDQPPVLLNNVDSKRYYRIKPDPYFDQKEVGRGAIQLDWDNDGYPDVASSQLWYPPHVLINDTPHENNHLNLRLIGTNSPRTPIGTIVHVEAGGKKQIRQLAGGGSYLSQSQPMIFFGLGQESSAKVSIYWPDGSSQVIENASANQTLTIIQKLDD